MDWAHFLLSQVVLLDNVSVYGRGEGNGRTALVCTIRMCLPYCNLTTKLSLGVPATCICAVYRSFHLWGDEML